MTTEQQLPEGWKIERLGDIAISEKGKKPKNQSSKKTDKFCYPYVDIEAFEKGIIKSYTDGAKCVLCDENDFLMVWDGARSGLVGKGIKGALGSTLVRISLPNINNLYAYYFLLSKYKEINTRAKGSGTPHVDPDLLWNYAFPIPPNQETQQAIVNKIESLFDEIDEGIGRLKTAARQIQQYRQSLLKNAFNGELTKEWRSKQADTLPSENELLAQIQTTREQHHAQQLADWQTAVSQWEQNGKEGKKPSKPKASTQAVKFEENVADLPRGWLESSLGDTTDVFVGSTPSRKNNEYWNGDISWVSSGEVNFSNIFETKEKITNLGLSNSSTNIHPIGTVMLAMIGEGKTRGQAGILKIEACHNQNTAAIRVNKKYLLSEYLYYFFMFNYEQTRRIGSGNNQKALNKTIIENMSFPICSLTEQTQIIAILESKLKIGRAHV